MAGLKVMPAMPLLDADQLSFFLSVSPRLNVAVQVQPALVLDEQSVFALKLVGLTLRIGDVKA